MTSQLMSPETASTLKPAARQKPQKQRQRPEPTVQDIIASARRKPVRLPAKATWVLCAATGGLFWASFMPLDFGPLAWIALVPLLMLVRIPQRTRWMYTAITVTGIATMTACLQWMRLGDATMYPAWFLLATYCGLYFPMFVVLSRVAVHRLRVPLAVAVPVLWTGLEYARGTLMSGFAWYFLSHTQYRWLELIQISDLVGAYGVSFLIATTAAVLAGLIPRGVFGRLKLLDPKSQAECPIPQSLTRGNAIAVLACAGLFAAVLSYGWFRRSQAEFEAGPRVALIQGNFVSAVKHDPAEAVRIFHAHRTMTGVAVQHQPDFVIWPETMYREPLIAVQTGVSDDDISRLAKEIGPKEVRSRAESGPNNLADRSAEAGAAMIIGLESVEFGKDSLRKYNSAAFSTPSRGYVARYDKIHRVPFGEFVPLKEQLPWLVVFTPFPPDFGVDAGEKAAVFQYKGYRCTPVICFEDTVPHLVRNIANAAADADESHRPPDFLVNLTNDGWFHGSAELDQHLITAAFRSIECRTPMVRAVNTGISAVIDGDGAVVEPEVFLEYAGRDENTGAPVLHSKTMRDGNGRWRKSLNAVLVQTVPLDGRESLYLWWGDWFAGLCAAFAAFCLLAGLFLRRRDRQNDGRELFVKTVAAPDPA